MKRWNFIGRFGWCAGLGSFFIPEVDMCVETCK